MEPLHPYYQGHERKNAELIDCCCKAIKYSGIAAVFALATYGLICLLWGT